jgi:hypothetical protein
LPPSFVLVRAAEEPELPGDLNAGRLLYRASMTDAQTVKDWRMEGPGKVSFTDGWMHMRSPGEKMHHVFWCPERFPKSFIAQWEAQNLETDAGLCIVFFAAAGRDGGSIFADDLPERDGNFRQYTRGKIRCYHTSYYANAAHNPDRQQTNLRKNPGFHLVQEGAEGIPTGSEKVHTITLAKRSNHIRLWVDDRKVIDWTDEGRKGGDPHGDGFIGLRQMKWTHFRYRNFRVWGVPDGAQQSQSWDDIPFAVPQVSGVRVDGDAEDWSGRGHEVPGLWRQVATGRWEVDPDANVRLGWDEKGLLALVRLSDDRWMEADTQNLLWKLDGIELYVARQPGSPQYYHVVVAPGMSDNHPELRYQIYDKRFTKEGELSAEIARTGKGRECIVEARLPWDNLNLEGQTGADFGFQVMINDHDADGKSYGKTAHSVWYRALGAAQDPGKMHRLRLAPADGRSVAADSELQYADDGGVVLVVRGAPKLAGQTVTVRRGGNQFATATLAVTENGSGAVAGVDLPDPGATGTERLSVQLDGIVFGRHDLSSAATREMRRIIREAGNAESEKKRYQILLELKEREDLPVGLRRDLRRLLPVIDWWANGREKAVKGTGGRAAEIGYLCRFFYPEAMLRRGGNYPPKVREESALYPLWGYYKARSLLWIPIQIGGIRRDSNKRERYYSKARRYLQIAGKAFPENRIIAMYNGEPYPWPADFDPDPHAPRWANLQREGLEKLTEVIHWWIENRQIDDGQYGGGWGDDVEMWRWWTPILVAFKDPKIIRAQSRLSRAILAEPHMKHGYTSHLSDVEHTAEDTGDSITPMIFLEPDNREWRGRALRIIELADQVWMAENQRGFLQFKSTWFNHSKVDTTPRRACDTVYHPRTFHPALIHWLRSGDQTVGRLITRWMDTWVDATAREENGKPAGITPSAIHWPDGEVGGGVEPWWKPRNYRNDLYSWPSAMSLMTRTMLLTYHMTGNEKYLEPIRSMAEIRMKYLNHPPEGDPEPGSAAWCALEGSPRFAGTGMARFLPSTLAKYRLLTADSAFDELLKADAGGYMKMRLGEGTEAMVADLEQNARAFRMNRPAYTSEMRWTDRVLTFNARWGNEGNGWDWPVPNTSVLYSAATGDPGDPRYFPLNAVRWLTEPRAFAALVTESGQKRFVAQLYHFGEEPRDLEAELYLLDAGRYELTVGEEEGRELASQTLEVAGPRTRISIDLPARKLCILRVEPVH